MHILGTAKANVNTAFDNDFSHKKPKIKTPISIYVYIIKKPK